jgi:hypothetical protein
MHIVGIYFMVFSIISPFLCSRSGLSVADLLAGKEQLMHILKEFVWAFVAALLLDCLKQLLIK